MATSDCGCASTAPMQTYTSTAPMQYGMATSDCGCNGSVASVSYESDCMGCNGSMVIEGATVEGCVGEGCGETMIYETGDAVIESSEQSATPLEAPAVEADDKEA